MLTTVFLNVSAHFICQQFCLYHTCYQDFFSILLFIAYSSVYEFIDLSIIFLVIELAHLIRSDLMIGFSFSFFHAIFIRFRPFLLQATLVGISVLYVVRLTWPLMRYPSSLLNYLNNLIYQSEVMFFYYISSFIIRIKY